MGKAKSGSRKSTPAIEILGVNEEASSVFFRQGRQLFTASHRLGWIPRSESVSIKPRRLRLPSKYQAATREVMLAATKRISLREQISQIAARGNFETPTNGLRTSFSTTQKMSRAYELPADMKAALERHMALM